MNEALTPPLLMTLVFAFALLAGLILKFSLATRQIKYVSSHRFEVPLAFRKGISLSAHQKAADYTVVKVRFGLIEMALSTTLLVGWTLLGGLHALNQFLLYLFGHGMAQQVALIITFIAIGALIELPLSLYQTFVIEERFGFNKMTFKLWMMDLVKSSLVACLIGIPILTLILWVMGTTGPQWWIWAWSLWMGFNLLLLMIYPTFIAPMFNKFQPLADESLKLRVTALMNRCGFASKGFFVMDGSRRSAHANAYFTGFGSAKRVVFYDTLLKQLSPPEVDAVLAHELGHFKHKHIVKRILSLFALSFLAFAVLGWIGTQSWFYTGLGVKPNIAPPNDALALLLFILSAPLFTFFISPLMSLVSRKHEFEADAYATRQTSGEALSSALLKLYQDNASTLTPDPWYVKFYYSHPPASERLARLSSV